MKEIKLTIDGKEVRLTDEQIKALGIKVDDGCVCDRVNEEGEFYLVTKLCTVYQATDKRGTYSTELYDAGNYYRDESYAKQVALHQQLNNLLRRYSEQHGGDKEWDGNNAHYYLTHNSESNRIEAFYSTRFKHFGLVCFSTLSIAEKAIDEVVKPFMKEHLEFVW